MSEGIGRLLVGYREHSRKRHWLIDRYGVLSVGTRKCIAGCGHVVFFNASGIETMHEKDPEVICEECAALHHHDLKGEI